jgi:hypothetical protein
MCASFALFNRLEYFIQLGGKQGNVRWQTSQVDYLLEQRECSGDNSLRGDNLTENIRYRGSAQLGEAHRC